MGSVDAGSDCQIISKAPDANEFLNVCRLYGHSRDKDNTIYQFLSEWIAEFNYEIVIGVLICCCEIAQLLLKVHILVMLSIKSVPQLG